MKRVALFSEYIDQVVVDKSGKSPRYIAVSRHQKHIQLSPLVYVLLEKVAAGSSFSDISHSMNVEGKGSITPEELQKAYEMVIEKIKRIDGEQGNKQRDFWLKLPLVPAATVQNMAASLTCLFHPLVAFGILSSIIVLAAYALEHGLFQKVLEQDPITVIVAYLLFLISLLVHEFGHSSACVKGGIKPSEIGAAIYLVFPVFYSDVSASWQLSRWKKVRVDTGGVYFQLCVGAIYLLLLLVTQQKIFQVAVAMVLSSCCFSLNPFLKFDGYWVLSDLLNIPNLYKQPAYLLTHCYQVLVQKQRRQLRWSPMTTIFIFIYALLKAGFWVYLLMFLLPFVWQAITSYPGLLIDCIAHIQQGSRIVVLHDLQRLVANGLVILIAGGGLCRFCLRMRWSAQPPGEVVSA